MVARVIRINLESETEIELVRDYLYESKGIINLNYFNGILEEYDAQTFQYGTQRGRSRESGGTNQLLQYGSGNIRKVKLSLKANTGLSEGEFRKIIANLKFEKKV